MGHMVEPCMGIKEDATASSFCVLAHLDSNQDKQNQNLSYYHYTMGQCYKVSDLGVQK